MKYISRYINTSSRVITCDQCGKVIPHGTPLYMITNRADETTCNCPDCAAHYMAETLEAVSDTEYSNIE